MKERPINFKAWEVQAIRAGRKTQFRRAVNPQPAWPARHPSIIGPRIECHNSLAGMYSISSTLMQEFGFARCPYGAPGDRLWVRETFLHQSLPGYPPATLYRADGHSDEIGPWKPSIHMPRWASRITLEIVSVRVERLNEISEGDAMAEGVTWPDRNGAPNRPPIDLKGVSNLRIAAEKYCDTWKSINGPGSWAENPWVWVVEFKRV